MARGPAATVGRGTGCLGEGLRAAAGGRLAFARGWGVRWRECGRGCEPSLPVGVRTGWWITPWARVRERAATVGRGYLAFVRSLGCSFARPFGGLLADGGQGCGVGQVLRIRPYGGGDEVAEEGVRAVGAGLQLGVELGAQEGVVAQLDDLHQAAVGREAGDEQALACIRSR